MEVLIEKEAQCPMYVCWQNRSFWVSKGFKTRLEHWICESLDA